MCFNLQLLLMLMITFDHTTTINSNPSSSKSSASASIIAQYYPHKQQQSITDCGVRSSKRERFGISIKDDLRSGKIIAGIYTKEGQFPWQASLELLHPTLGFLGHWCGAVLIHQYWVLSAAHCVHNDLFNLPIPPLWTVVLGDYNRAIESGYEQRIPVEKIIMHRKYENFLHDLVLMKLSVPANLVKKSNIRRICLPFLHSVQQAGLDSDEDFETIDGINDVPEKMDNFLRSVQMKREYQNVSLPTMKQLMDLKILNRLKRINQLKRINHKNTMPLRPQRFNDKYLDFYISDDNRENFQSKYQQQHQQHQQHQQQHQNHQQQYLRYVGNNNNNNNNKNNNNNNNKELAYMDCIATGWGKANISGDLTDILLKTNVPLHTNKRCKEAYGNFVRIHSGHLCAGKLNGKGGTCVGDSGGPLQCRLTKNGPWILAGVTSFGSGCALRGYPDVYVRISHYMKWIQDTIAYE